MEAVSPLQRRSASTRLHGAPTSQKTVIFDLNLSHNPNKPHLGQSLLADIAIDHKLMRLSTTLNTKFSKTVYFLYDLIFNM
jgi:hypothetical protein